MIQRSGSSVCADSLLRLTVNYVSLFMPGTPPPSGCSIFPAITDTYVAALLISFLSYYYQKHAGADQNSTTIKSAEYLNFDGNLDVDFNLGSILE